MNPKYVPTRRERWEFLQGLNAATQAGFKRMDEGFARMDVRFAAIDQRFEAIDQRFDRVDASLASLERRVIRIDDRLSAIEDLNVRSRLDDHEHRIARLEQRS